MMKKYFSFALALLFVFVFVTGARATDIYNDGEIIIDSDNLYPKTDGGSTLGKLDHEFAGLHIDSITLGGVAKTSWGSVVSPMTDYVGYVAPTDAGSKLKLYDDGDLTLGGAVATDVVIIWDSDTNDYYIGTNDTENELQIGYGSAIGTTEQISITTGAKVYLGEDTDVDFGLIFQSGAQDYYFGIDYTGGQEEDLLCLGTGTTVGTTPALSIGKASGTVYVNHLDAPGDVDFDIGSADVDDVTIITDGGTLILDGTITLTDSEVISNATDDTIRIASNDLDTILEVYTPYDTTGDATLKLSADLGDEAGEQWTITSTGATTDLVIGCDDSASGTPVTTFTIADNGIVTTINYVDNKITDTTTNAVVDVCKLTHDGGAAAAGVGVGLVFQVDDAGGIEEQGSIDVSLSAVTDGAENADMIVKLNSIGTMREVLRIDTDVTATENTTFELTSWTIETNGIVDMLELKLENTADTGTTDLGMGISFQLEDETAVEEHASMDIQMTDGVRASCDTDIIFRQDVAGTMEERVRFDADGGTIALVGTLPNAVIGDGGDEDIGIYLNSDTTDYYIASENTLDDLLLGVGSAIGTTPAIGVDANADVHIYQDLVVDKGINFALDTSTSDDYVISLPVAPAAYTLGMQITFQAVTANTGACAVNVNSLGLKSLKMLHDQDPGNNFIEASSIVMAVYDGSNFQMIQPAAN